MRAKVFIVFSCLVAAAFADPRRVLSLSVSETNPRNGEGDFVHLRDGRDMFVYTEYVGTSNDDHARAHLVKRYTSDGGETWTPPVEVTPRSGRMNDMSASLLRIRGGKLALFYLRKNSAADCCPVMRVSTDESETWSAETDCIAPTNVAYYVLNNARAERLGSGRIVLPLARHDRAAPEGFEFARLLCVYSDDDGRTWQQGAEYLPQDEAGKPVLVQEPGVIELKDGRLYLYARTNRGRQWQAFSKDGGRTFADFGPSPIVGPRGPATIKRLPNGELLLVWNDHETYPQCAGLDPKWVGRRAPLSIAFSRDEGLTWVDRQTIDPEIEKGFFCYFATLVVNDSLLLHTYDQPHLKGSCVYKIPLPKS